MPRTPWLYRLLVTSLGVRLIENLFLKNLEIRNAHLLHAHSGPTIFLSNHTGEMDPFRITAALVREYFAPDRDVPFVQHVVANDVFERELLEAQGHPLQRGYLKLKDLVLYTMTASIGSMTIARHPTLKPAKKNANPLRLYAKTLANGAHLYLYPTGAVTKDGRVSYTLGHRQFEEKHLRYLAEKVHGLHAQFMHYLEEPFSGKQIVSVGEKHQISTAPTRSLDYLVQMEKLAPITSLQLFASYILHSFDTTGLPFLVLDKEHTRRVILEAEKKLARDGQRIISLWDKHEPDLFDFLHEQKVGGHTPEGFIVTRYGSMERRFLTYHANEIAHIALPMGLFGGGNNYK